MVPLPGLAVLDDQQGDLDVEALRIYASGVTGKPKDILYSNTRLMHVPIRGLAVRYDQ